MELSLLVIIAVVVAVIGLAAVIGGVVYSVARSSSARGGPDGRSG